MQIRFYTFLLAVCFMAACKPNEVKILDVPPESYNMQSCHMGPNATWDTSKIASAVTGKWLLRRKTCQNSGEVTVTTPVRLEINADHSVKVFAGEQLIQSSTWRAVKDTQSTNPYITTDNHRIRTEPVIDWMDGTVFVCPPYLLFNGAMYYGGPYSPTGCEHYFRRQD